MAVCETNSFGFSSAADIGAIGGTSSSSSFGDSIVKMGAGAGSDFSGSSSSDSSFTSVPPPE